MTCLIKLVLKNLDRKMWIKTSLLVNYSWCRKWYMNVLWLLPVQQLHISFRAVQKWCHNIFSKFLSHVTLYLWHRWCRISAPPPPFNADFIYRWPFLFTLLILYNNFYIFFLWFLAYAISWFLITLFYILLRWLLSYVFVFIMCRSSLPFHFTILECRF